MGMIEGTIRLNNEMSPVLNNIIDSMDLLVASAYDVQKETEGMLDTRSIESASIKLADARQRLDSITAEQNNWNSRIEHTNELMGKTRNRLSTIFGAYLGFRGVKLFTGASDEAAQMQSRLNFLVDSQEELVEFQEMLYQSAQRSRGEYQMTMDIVSKLGAQAKEAFSDNRETVQFAENLNKLFTIAGTEAQGVDSVMYNLTQAMALGVLRGQDLNAVMSNTPQIVQIVAEYMGESSDKIRELAEEGRLTADVVKKAILNATDDIHSQFESMPMTFGEVAIKMKNQFIRAMEPAFKRFSDFINSDNFANAIKNAMAYIGLFADLLNKGITQVIKIAEIAYEIWEFLKYPILGVVAILTLYYTITSVSTKITMLSAKVTGGLAFAKELLAVVTGRLTIEQTKLNATMLASPIFWIPALIIGVISLIYGVIGAINKVKGTTYSATGFVVGAIATGVAFIGNLIIGLFNFFIGIGTAVANGFISFAEFMANVFVSPVASVKNLLLDMAKFALEVLSGIAKVIDTVFGSNLSDSVGNWANTVNNLKADLESEDNTIELERIAPEYIERIQYGQTYAKWYEKGDNFANNIKDKFSLDITDDLLLDDGDLGNYDDQARLMDSINDIANSTAGTKANTDSLADGISVESDDISYLKELAEMRAIQNFSFEKIEVIANNSFGDIHETADLDGWIDGLTEGLSEAVETTMGGVPEYGY